MPTDHAEQEHRSDAASQERLEWPTTEDHKWAATVKLRLLLDHGASTTFADEVVAEAHTAVVEEGRDAHDLFGDATEHARTTATERLGDEHRAHLDAQGLTPAERCVGGLLTFGALGTVGSVVAWIRAGLWIDLTGSSLTALGTVILTVLLMIVAFSLWSAGRVRSTWWCVGGIGATIFAGSGAASALPDAHLFSLPVPVLTVVSLAFIALVWTLPETTFERWFPSSPAPTGDDERWLSQLDGLLRGRHTMSARDARGHVREVRQHLTADRDDRAGQHGSAEDIFGPVETYALLLAETPKRKARAVQRRTLYIRVGALALLLTRLIDLGRASQPLSFWFWALLVVAVAGCGYVAHGWYRYRATGPTDAAKSRT